jgi:hypothetical protein
LASLLQMSDYLDASRLDTTVRCLMIEQNLFRFAWWPPPLRVDWHSFDGINQLISWVRELDLVSFTSRAVRQARDLCGA